MLSDHHHAHDPRPFLAVVRILLINKTHTALLTFMAGWGICKSKASRSMFQSRSRPSRFGISGIVMTLVAAMTVGVGRDGMMGGEIGGGGSLLAVGRPRFL